MSTTQLDSKSYGQYNAKAYSAGSPTSPLAPTVISRRDPGDHDVQIEILYCGICHSCLLYTSPSPRDRQKSRMPSSA